MTPPLPGLAVGIALTLGSLPEPPVQRPTALESAEPIEAMPDSESGSPDATSSAATRPEDATDATVPTDPEVAQSPDPAPPPPVVDCPPGEPPMQTRMTIPPPLYKGTGILISAGILGAAGIGTKIAFTLLDRANGYLGLSIRYIGQFPNLLVGSALGLLGGGMAKRGQWAAHRALFHGSPPRMRPRPILGWLLFGAGVGVWAVTRAGHYTCVTERCELAVLEAGYYGSLALSAPGIALAGYGTGYKLYERRFGGLAIGSVGPLPLARGGGIALEGAF